MKVNATAAATAGSLDITWSPPLPVEANGPIVGYTLKMTRIKFGAATETQSLSGETAVFEKEGKVHNKIILLCYNAVFSSGEGLTAYEPVVVAIAARTEHGLGPFSNNETFYTSQAGKLANQSCA